MKKSSRILLGICSLVFLFSPNHIFAWAIDSFTVEAWIQSDRTVTVKERIIADFTPDEHHGIYRYIPLSYINRLGQSFRLRMHVDELKSSQDKDQYWKSYSGGRLYIKIGNPNLEYKGLVGYTLQYTLQNVMTDFPSHNELYWNVTGNEWNVPIRKAKFIIHLPPECKNQTVQYAAFVGMMGSRDNTSIQVERRGQEIVYEVMRPLQAYEGLTAVLGVPLGMLKQVSLFQKVKWFFQDNWPYGAPLLVFLFLFLKWWRHGKDPQGKGTVAVTYESPNNLTPAEIGTLIDEKVDMRDITATLVDLAVKGYLKIEEEEDKDFIFRKTIPKIEISIKPHEKFILDHLFLYGDSCRLSGLKYKFSADYLKPIRERIYHSLIAQGYFTHSPDIIRKVYRFGGIFLIVLGTILAILFFNIPQLSWIAAPVPLVVSGVLSGLLFFIFAPLMPKKTRAGVETYEEIRGLEEYIARAEAETFQKADPKLLFETLLPFAISFGLTKSWINKFSNLFQDPPQWYSSRSYSAWNMNYFSRSLNQMERSSSQTFTAVPRTSGGSGFSSGGSSGGGFGGGGGGAW